MYKIHIEHPYPGINGQGHMTKMAAIPIYGKNLNKISSTELGVNELKLGMQHWGLMFYKAGINDDLG